MTKKFYIKKVVVVLKEERWMSRFQPLTERLKQETVEVQRILSGEEQCHAESAQGDSVLYITDCDAIAELLLERKLPILGFLHEGGDSLPGVDYLMESPEETDIQYIDRVYRRYQRLPWDILETERCMLRETIPEDVDAFYEIYQHPEITEYMEALYPEKEQERAYIREYIEKVYRYFEFGVWTVILKETGEIIGRAGFSVREGYELPELGYVIGVPWQGQGIACEICSAILRYGKEEFDFDCVQAMVDSENKASLALCRKLGFTAKGKVPKLQGEYVLLCKNL